MNHKVKKLFVIILASVVLWLTLNSIVTPNNQFVLILPFTSKPANLTPLHLESPDVFSNLPVNFISGYRNFCWYADQNLQCLPRVYLAGMPKCGSTELFRKLVWHAELSSPRTKENHYWARKRLGKPGNHLHFDSSELNSKELFSNFVKKFRTENLEESSILVDGTQSLLWDLMGWETRYPWANQPPYSNADLIHEVTPNAKILVIVRDPVQRLYSDYLYFSKTRDNRTFYSFGEDVRIEVVRFNACLQDKDLRACCYDSKNNPKVRLNLGIYICFIRDWKERFKDNLLVVRLEDYAASPATTLLRIFDFLEVQSPNQHELDVFIESSSPANTRHKGDIEKGDMTEETFRLLNDFYRTYNTELSHYLGDSKFLYQDFHN